MRLRSLLSAPWLIALALAAAGCDDASSSNGGDEPEPDIGHLRLDAEVDAAPDTAVGQDGSLSEDARVEHDGASPDVGPEADAGLPPDSGPTVCELPPVPEQPALDLSARCRAEGGPLRIRDLRDTRCPDHQAWPTRQPGVDVSLPEVVVTAVFDKNFVVQDPEGGAFSGLWIYNRAELPVDALVPGTRLRISGQLIEFYTLTELVLSEESVVEVLGAGEPPAPILIADPGRLADGGDLTEPMESVLVQIQGARVENTAPDCPTDFGMFVVSGGLRIDDKSGIDYSPSKADIILEATGVLHYSFEHNKLFPRGLGDLKTEYCGGIPDKCETAECPVEAGIPENRKLIITEIQDNPSGEDEQREFIELYNPGNSAIDLTGWWVQDCGGHRAELSGRLEARSYLVLASSLDWAANGGIDADLALGDLFLPNGAGSVMVFDGSEGALPTAGSLVDQVRYSSEAPWPTDRGAGHSLELMEPAGDNQDGSGWTSGSDRYGDGGWGTPGSGYRD